MAYRGEDAGDVLVADTADGKLEVAFSANRLTLKVGPKSLHLVDRVATVVEEIGKSKKPKRASFAIEGIVFARGIPREDMGLWIEAQLDRVAKTGRGRRKPEPIEPRTWMRRIFGVSPVSLFHPEGLHALAKLDSLAARLRVAVDEYATAAGLWSARGVEIGGGHELDKVLFADYPDLKSHAIYARKLFRDRARVLALVNDDGRIQVTDGKTREEVEVISKFSITVRGDYIRFADRQGTDVARIAVPWVGPEEREEIARRIGQLVHRG